MSSSFIPTKIAVAIHPRFPKAFDEAQAIVDYLKEKGIDAPIGTLNDEDLRKRVKEGEFDLLISVGGDGTMLRAGHLCAPCEVPILGINMGKLGFLIQVERSAWQGELEQLLAGNFWIEKRLMILAELFRAGEKQGAWHALNEVVVSRGQYLNPVHISASIDGLELATYVADGLLASTATGSTAYALAAGGPILPPELRNILIVPIAPHLSIDRAVVLSEGVAVNITIHSENAVLSVDGQSPIGLDAGDRVDVYSAEYSAKFIRFEDLGYFYRNLRAHMNQNPSTEK
ncbi:MAG: NAD(+)/NADH kinase [Anaerolineae bacterium]|mgnify:CR=1 FL=1|jgi:NAD+ kinase|nr:NAD(+)/NADH kinase [Anaerolineae bacterium]MBT7075367.1 NAD(+)/NADH kinase [Anaerolineae bacterium]MBT7782208.1 NAD(+)/NADH kinase [Anaerolineae bacterium]